jgi:hypothetical protein
VLGDLVGVCRVVRIFRYSQLERTLSRVGLSPSQTKDMDPSEKFSALPSVDSPAHAWLQMISKCRQLN